MWKQFFHCPRKTVHSLTGRIIYLKSGASEVFITLLLLFLCHPEIIWLSAHSWSSPADYNTICYNHQPQTRLSYSTSIFNQLRSHSNYRQAGYFKSPHRDVLRSICSIKITSFSCQLASNYSNGVIMMLIGKRNAVHYTDTENLITCGGYQLYLSVWMQVVVHLIISNLILLIFQLSSTKRFMAFVTFFNSLKNVYS